MDDTLLESLWQPVCAVDAIWPDTGACALVNGRQVAVFRFGAGAEAAWYAIGNHDPASGANVLSRGLLGSLGGRPVVASPIYKQHYDLVTGACLEDAGLRVPVYPVRVAEGQVWVVA